MSSQGPRQVSGQQYAKGKYSKAQCPVCTEVVSYGSLKKRWDGQWTCGPCLDPKHPADRRRNFRDAMTLHHPKPESFSFNPTFGDFGVLLITHDSIGTGTVVSTSEEWVTLDGERMVALDGEQLYFNG